MTKLEILEISNNNINNLSKLKNLKELVCNNLEIINLSYLDNLESLEIINTNINKLDYFKYLNVVITDKMILNIRAFAEVNKLLGRVGHSFPLRKDDGILNDLRTAGYNRCQWHALRPLRSHFLIESRGFCAWIR